MVSCEVGASYRGVQKTQEIHSRKGINDLYIISLLIKDMGKCG